MKLHLPVGLRSSVLACLAVFSGFATTLSTGVIAGGVFALSALSVADAAMDPFQNYKYTSTVSGLTTDGANFLTPQGVTTDDVVYFSWAEDDPDTGRNESFKLTGNRVEIWGTAGNNQSIVNVRNHYGYGGIFTIDANSILRYDCPIREIQLKGGIEGDLTSVADPDEVGFFTFVFDNASICFDDAAVNGGVVFGHALRVEGGGLRLSSHREKNNFTFTGSLTGGGTICLSGTRDGTDKGDEGGRRTFSGHLATYTGTWTHSAREGVYWDASPILTFGGANVDADVTKTTDGTRNLIGGNVGDSSHYVQVDYNYNGRYFIGGNVYAQRVTVTNGQAEFSAGKTLNTNWGNDDAKDPYSMKIESGQSAILHGTSTIRFLRFYRDAVLGNTGALTLSRTVVFSGNSRIENYTDDTVHPATVAFDNVLFNLSASDRFSYSLDGMTSTYELFTGEGNNPLNTANMVDLSVSGVRKDQTAVNNRNTTKESTFLKTLINTIYENVTYTGTKDGKIQIALKGRALELTDEGSYTWKVGSRFNRGENFRGEIEEDQLGFRQDAAATDIVVFNPGEDPDKAGTVKVTLAGNVDPTSTTVELWKTVELSSAEGTNYTLSGIVYLRGELVLHGALLKRGYTLVRAATATETAFGAALTLDLGDSTKVDYTYELSGYRGIATVTSGHLVHSIDSLNGKTLAGCSELTVKNNAQFTLDRLDYSGTLAVEGERTDGNASLYLIGTDEEHDDGTVGTTLTGGLMTTGNAVISTTNTVNISKSAELSGSGTLTKKGDGLLNLCGKISHAGTLVVEDGSISLGIDPNNSLLNQATDNDDTYVSFEKIVVKQGELRIQRAGMKSRTTLSLEDKDAAVHLVRTNGVKGDPGIIGFGELNAVNGGNIIYTGRGNLVFDRLSGGTTSNSVTLEIAASQEAIDQFAQRWDDDNWIQEDHITTIECVKNFNGTITVAVPALPKSGNGSTTMSGDAWKKKLEDEGYAFNHKLIINGIDQAKGYTASVDASVEVFSTNFSKKGEGSFNVGTLTATNVLNMYYTGELVIDNLVIADKTMLSYDEATEKLEGGLLITKAAKKVSFGENYDGNVLLDVISYAEQDNDGFTISGVNIDLGLSCDTNPAAGGIALERIKVNLFRGDVASFIKMNADTNTWHLVVAKNESMIMGTAWDQTWGDELRNAPEADELPLLTEASEALQAQLHGGTITLSTDEQSGYRGMINLNDGSAGNVNFIGGGNGAETEHSVEIWAKLTAGDYAIMAGGNQTYGTNYTTGQSFYGDTHLYIADNLRDEPVDTTVRYVIGGNYGNASGMVFKGDTYISMVTNSLTGSLCGGSALFTSAGTTTTGNSHIRVYAVLGKNTTDIFGRGDNAGSAVPNAIVGANMYAGKGGGTNNFIGDTEIIVKLEQGGGDKLAATGTFAKKIIGGDYLGAFNSNFATSILTGSTKVLISSPDSVTFSGYADGASGENIVAVAGGSYAEAYRNSVINGSTYLEINGGTYNNRVAGGSFVYDASSASIEQGATTIVTKGTFTGAHLTGGNYVMGPGSSQLKGGIDLAITDGTFTNSRVAAAGYLDKSMRELHRQEQGGLEVHGGVNLAITGGTYNGGEEGGVFGGFYFNKGNMVTTARNTGGTVMTITGGTFSSGIISGGSYIGSGEANGENRYVRLTDSAITLTVQEGSEEGTVTPVTIDATLYGGSLNYNNESRTSIEQGAITLNLVSGSIRDVYAAGHQESTGLITAESTLVNLSSEMTVRDDATISGGYEKGADAANESVKGSRTLVLADGSASTRASSSTTPYDLDEVNFRDFDVLNVASDVTWKSFETDGTSLQKLGAGKVSFDEGNLDAVRELTVGEGILDTGKLGFNGGWTSRTGGLTRLNMGEDTELHTAELKFADNAVAVLKNSSIVETDSIQGRKNVTITTEPFAQIRSEGDVTLGDGATIGLGSDADLISANGGISIGKNAELNLGGGSELSSQDDMRIGNKATVTMGTSATLESQSGLSFGEGAHVSTEEWGGIASGDDMSFGSGSYVSLGKNTKLNVGDTEDATAPKADLTLAAGSHINMGSGSKMTVTGTLNAVSNTVLEMDLTGSKGKDDVMITTNELEMGGKLNIRINGIWKLDGGEYALVDVLTDDDSKGLSDEQLRKITWENQGVLKGRDLMRGADGKSLVINVSSDNVYAQLADNDNSMTGANILRDVAVDPQTPDQKVIDLLNALEAATSVEEGNRILAAAVGSSAMALGSALAGDIERQLSTIRNRTTTMGVVPGAATDLPYVNAWINAEGDYRSMDADGMLPGYTLSSYGGTVGVDVDCTDHLTVGLAVTAMYGDFEADAADEAEGDFDTMYVSAFARYNQRRWVHTFVATVGTMDATLERNVSFSGGGYSTEGETSGSAFGFMYELGYTMPMDEDATCCLQPLVNLTWRHASVDAFDEEKSDGALSFGEQSYDAITLGLGARLQATVGENSFNRSSLFEARALLKFELGDNQSEGDVSFLGRTKTGTLVSAEQGAVGIELGAGIIIPVSAESGSLFLDGSFEFRSSCTSLNAVLGYRVNF